MSAAFFENIFNKQHFDSVNAITLSNAKNGEKNAND